MGTVTIGNRTIETSNTDKVFFPESGITKGDLIDYYRNIGSIMIPHMRGRPLMMHRLPDGIEGEDFYQKDIPDYFPSWIKRTRIKKKEDGSVVHALCENAAALVYMANLGCVTFHLWLSKADQVNQPDRMIFDLDPPGDDFEPVRQGAQALRATLEEVGLMPFVMTTGSRGLHVLVPLRREHIFDTVRDFARDVAAVLEKRERGAYTVEPRKEARGGRLFIDTLRNAYAQTAVAPYSLRGKPGAPVATPLDWDELGKKDLGPQHYTVKNIFRRLSQKDDPWKEMSRHARSLQPARDRVKKLMPAGK